MKNTTKKILMPIPNYGYDPTEVAVPWKVITSKNHTIVFATPNGKVATADQIMLNGKGLYLWKPMLKAQSNSVKIHKDMIESTAFKNPISYEDIHVDDYDGLILPGGHDKKVKDYLESKILQNKVIQFFNQHKTVGAICHGLVVAARSIDSKTNQSVLYNYNTTALLKMLELTGYYMTCLWMGDYYLTYPEITVEDEVKSVLKSSKQFIKGKLPIFRDSEKNLGAGFHVVDKNLVTARWPGDAFNFSNAFCNVLASSS